MWWTCSVLSTVLVFATAATLAFFVSERKVLADALAAQGALRAALMRPVEPQAVAMQTDFTADLPLHADVPAMLAILQRSCVATGVTLQEIRIEERKATDRELGVAQVTLQLHGTYPNIKQVLIDVEEYSVALTVRNLSLHRNPLPSLEAEGTVTLAVWARPLIALPPTSSASHRRVPGSS